jgi:hypothetical protein
MQITSGLVIKGRVEPPFFARMFNVFTFQVFQGRAGNMQPVAVFYEMTGGLIRGSGPDETVHKSCCGAASLPAGILGLYIDRPWQCHPAIAPVPSPEMAEKGTEALALYRPQTGQIRYFR